MPRAVDLSDKTSSTSNIVRTGCQNSNSTKVKRSICEVSTFHQRVVPSRDPDKRTHTHTNTYQHGGTFRLVLRFWPFLPPIRPLCAMSRRIRVTLAPRFPSVVCRFIYLRVSLSVYLCSKSVQELTFKTEEYSSSAEACLPACLFVCLSGSFTFQSHNFKMADIPLIGV